MAVDDADYEPNNDMENAIEIAAGTYEGLTFTDTTDEDDWFYVDLAVGEVLRVEMEVTNGVDGDYFYLNFKDENSTFIDWDGFYYYDSPDEFDDVLGDLYYYAEEDAITVYIWCEYTGSHTGGATYNLSVEVFDAKTTPKFEYGVAVEDELEFNIANNVELTASDAVYDLFQEIYDNETLNMTDNPFKEGLNIKTVVQDILDFISDSVDLQFTISDIYNMDFHEGISTDFIEGDIAAKVDEEYTEPTALVEAKLYEFLNLTEPYLTTDAFNDLEDAVNSMIDDLDDVDPEDFQDMILVTQGYFDNISDFLELGSIAELDNGTTFPAWPDEHYVPFISRLISKSMSYVSSIVSLLGSAELCYPTDFSFANWYQFGLDAYSFMQAYAEQEGEEIPAIMDYSIEDILNNVGVTAFHVNDQSIGITWSLSGIDFNEVEDMIEYTSGDLEDDLAEELAYAGITLEDTTLVVSMALEYDEDMVLASVANYVEISITLTDSGLPSELAGLDGETISISSSQNVLRDGYKAPTVEQINEGDLGEARNMGGGIFANIPGYSAALIGLISLVSLSGLVIRMKRRH